MESSNAPDRKSATMPENEKHTVVLLHGMGHDLGNMAFVEKALRREGYQTLNLSYPSRKHDIKILSGWLDGKIMAAQAWSHPGRVHFVGHSLVGLVIGSYLARHRS